MDVSFRPARPEDAAELWRLNTAFNGPGDKAPAEMAADLAAPGGELTFVAQGDRGLVGFCCCQVKRSWCYREPAAELTVCGAGLPPDGGGKRASGSGGGGLRQAGGGSPHPADRGRQRPCPGIL